MPLPDYVQQAVSPGSSGLPDYVKQAATKQKSNLPDYVKQAAGINEEPGLMDKAKQAFTDLGEGAASVVGGMLSLPVSGAVGLTKLAASGGDVDEAVKSMQNVQQAMQYEPQTEGGKTVAKVASYPFEKLAQLGAAAGDWVMDKTNNPVAATAVNTGIEALPVWLFPALKAAPKVVDKVKSSNWYRKATIKERGVVLQTLEEAMAKNPNLTETMAARMSQQWFAESMAKRNAGEGSTQPRSAGGAMQTEPVQAGKAVPPGQGFTMRPPEEVYSNYSPELAKDLQGRALPPGERGFTMRPPEEVYSSYSPELAAQAKGIPALPPGQGFELVEPKPKTIRRPAYTAGQEQKPVVVRAKVYKSEGMARRQMDGLAKKGTIDQQEYDVYPVEGGFQIQSRPQEQPAQQTEATRGPEQAQVPPAEEMPQEAINQPPAPQPGQAIKSGNNDLVYQGQDAMGLHNFRIESEGPAKLANISTKTLDAEDISKTVEAAKQRFTPKPERIAKTLGKDDMINGITRDEAGDMLADGDEAILSHISEGMEKHGKMAMEDAIRNQEITEVAGVPKSERGKIRERIAKLKPQIDEILGGEKKEGVKKSFTTGQEAAQPSASKATQEISGDMATTTTRQFNPYLAKYEAAKKRYEKYSGGTAKEKAMAESFPLGAGFGRGSQRSRNKAIDSSVDRAVKATEAKKEMNYYKEMVDAYDRGDITAQGRSVKKEATVKAENNYDDYILSRVKPGDRVTFLQNPSAAGHVVERVNKKTVRLEGGSNWPFADIAPWKDGKPMTMKEVMADLKQWRESQKEETKYSSTTKGTTTLHDITDIPRLIIEELKKRRINMPTEDMRYIEMATGLPTWMADKYPQLRPVQEIIDNKFRNQQMIKHQYHTEYHEAWKDLTKSEVKKLGKILYKGDKLEMELSPAGLAKLTPNMRKAYTAIQDINKSMWLDDMRALMEEMGAPRNEIESLMRQYGNIPGWMPHPRRGRYYGRIVDKDGNTTYRQHFDDIILTITRVVDRQGGFGVNSALVRRKLNKLAEAGDIIEFGENNKKLTEEAYMQLSPAAIQEIIDAAIGESEKVPGSAKAGLKVLLKSAVVDVLRERGFMAHAIKRKGVPGFNQDQWQQALLDHASAWAGFKSKVLASRELSKAWGAVDWSKIPNIRKYANKHVTDYFTNSDRVDVSIDKARAVMFRTYLSGVVKSAVIQLTQNHIAAVPRLTTETNWSGPKMYAEMTRAAADIVTAIGTKARDGMTKRETALANRLTAEENAGLTRARKNGIVGNMMMDEMMGMQLGTYGSISSKVDKVLGFMFQSAEAFNRETTYIVAFRIAKERGYPFEQAARFAEKIIDETQWRYGKTNLPPFARGNITKLGRAPYSFRHYPYSLFHMWMKLAGMDRGKWAILKSIGAILFFGGASSLPFLSAFSWAYRKYTGRDLTEDVARDLKEYGIPEDVTIYGAPGLFGIDLSGSLATDFPTKASEVIGVPASLYTSTKNMIGDITDKDYQRAVEDFPLMPSMIKNPLAAARMSGRGIENRAGKQKLDENAEQVRLSAGEQALKSIGFQPTKVSEMYRKDWTRAQIIQYWQDKKQAIGRRYIKAVNLYGARSKEAEMVVEEAKKFNDQLPILVPKITAQTFRSWRRPDMMSKREFAYEGQQGED